MKKIPFLILAVVILMAPAASVADIHGTAPPSKHVSHQFDAGFLDFYSWYGVGYYVNFSETGWYCIG